MNSEKTLNNIKKGKIEERIIYANGKGSRWGKTIIIICTIILIVTNLIFFKSPLPTYGVGIFFWGFFAGSNYEKYLFTGVKRYKSVFFLSLIVEISILILFFSELAK